MLLLHLAQLMTFADPGPSGGATTVVTIVVIVGLVSATYMWLVQGWLHTVLSQRCAAPPSARIPVGSACHTRLISHQQIAPILKGTASGFSLSTALALQVLLSAIAQPSTLRAAL